MHNIIGGTVITLILGLSAGAASADETALVRGQDMLKCRSIKTTDDRVACYDTLADRLIALPPVAQKISPAAAMTAAPPQEAKSFSTKILETFGLKEKEGEHITQTVAEIKFGPAKQFMITTTSGQVWLQSDSQKVKLPKRLPFTVIIERGAMGSYFLNADGQSTQYKARRLR